MGLAVRRLARFRALLREYGRFLDLMVDAVEKQSGGYVFDRAYVVSLADRALDAAEAVTFHLMALGSGVEPDLLQRLDRMKREVNAFLETRAPGVEDEVHLLREFYHLVFPLTAETDPESRVGTVHDLVYVLHERAGETVARFVRDVLDWEAAVEVRPGAGPRVNVVDLGEGLDLAVAPGSVCDASGVRSAALSVLMDGMSVETAAKTQVQDDRVCAVVTGERAFLLAFTRSGAFDLVDAQVTAAPEFNHIYARFAALPVPRGSLAGEVLRRVGFASAGTARGQSAWVSGLSAVETRERLGLVGRLFQRLSVLDRVGWDQVTVDSELAGLVA